MASNEETNVSGTILSSYNGPTPHPMITDPPTTDSAAVPAPREKLDSEFSEEENKLEIADTQLEIILSQGLPRHIFNNLNQTSTAKEIWDNVEMLMQGSGRTIQQRKEDLFDEYERFRAIGNESIHDYFVRFHKLVNDMKITQLNIPTHQMNTKFVNNLPAYWGKYVTNVKQTRISQQHLKFRSYTHLTPMSLMPKDSQKQEQSTSSPTAQSPKTHDATSLRLLISLSVTKSSSTHQQPEPDFPNSRTHHGACWSHVTEPVQRKAPGTDYNKLCFQANQMRMRKTQTWMNAPMLLASWPTLVIPLEQIHNPVNEIDDNTIPYNQYFLHQKPINVPTECICCTSDKDKLDLEHKVRQEQALYSANKGNAELVQENDLLKVTLSGKEKSIAILQSEKEKILSEKEKLADSYLDEIKPKKATNDLHKDILGTRNPGLGYMAKRAQPVLYDADTLLHPTHHPVSIWDSEEVLVHQVVSMKKMNEKPGHVRPANDFYAKLNALMFVPQKDLSGDQAYWLSANEIASQASKSATSSTPFVRKSRPPSQVLASLRKVNAVFPQLEGIIKERTTQKPDYVSDWCFDYAKQFVEQQLAENDNVSDNKNLTIEKKNLLIINECLIAECLEKDICSIVLTSDIVVPPSSNCFCEDLRSACDREHTKVPTEGSCDQQALETDRIQLKDTITSLRIQLDGLKVENVSLKKRFDELSKANTHSRTAYTENTKLKAQVTGTTSSGPSTSETPKSECKERKPTIRTLNNKNRVDSNLLVKHSVSVSKMNNVCGACNKSVVFANHTDCLVMCDGSVNVKPHQTKRFKRQPKKEWKPIKRVWKPINKPVANSKPQWKPTGRHFSLFEKHPLTRIMDSTDQPIELPPSASSSPKITMVSRFADHKLSDREAGSKGISGSTDCSMFRSLHSGQHSCHIRNYDMVDLLKGSRTTNLYSISLNDMMSASPVCLLTKASSTKSWLWHRRLNHLNFGTLNELARKNLVRGFPSERAKDHFVHLVSKKKTRFGWVRFLRQRDETPQVIEKFIVKTQRALNATVRFVRTDNGTEFVDDLFQWFDDDEVVPIPPVVPITPVNVPAAPAPENANGSPSTTVISEGAPAVTESLLPHQIPLPDTSDSDDETLFDHVDSNVFDTHNAPETASEASSSNSVNIDVTPNNQLPHVQKWTQAHPLENIIGDKDRPVSTRKQLETDAMWAYQEEIHEFERLDVWILVPCPDNILIIPLKWIFKIKLDEYGDVLKNKARLVAKGYRQEAGIDFEESFARC
ncbi:retrovirus-related pol polyprotein from transposon TNT 1-94 [Tanacetum coccineum]